MKIAMYDLEGHLLEVFETEGISKLSKDLKIPTSSLSGCLHGKNLQTNSRQFRKVVNSCQPITKIGSVVGLNDGVNYKPVCKFYKGKFINSYLNLKEASDINQIVAQSISKCIAGKTKKAGGFEWRYL